MTTVTFDVGGTVKKVLEHVVRSKPETLLCTLLDDPATQACEAPIFIDRSAYLFDAILDWYRHGFILLPLGMGVERMRLECAYYQLPDDVELRLDDLGGTVHAFDVAHAEARQAAAAEVAKLQAQHNEVVQSLVAATAYLDILDFLGKHRPKTVEEGFELGVAVVRQLNQFKEQSSRFPCLSMQMDESWWMEVTRRLNERGAQNGLACGLITSKAVLNQSPNSSVKLLDKQAGSQAGQ
mmetsp:Transcript_23539/g.43342  ORF Transcript_23539/g.43342 Transcript_23539/m.43342 type:complete len:238 (-) Transcript_23539:120-833(-)